MEKVCTRCQFRNPQSRRVCQVCGHAKFCDVLTADPAIAKQPVPSFSMLLNQTFAAAIEKIAELQKQVGACQQQESDVAAKQSPRSLNIVDEAITFESNDLDSMMAWFKSYGVDKPLILKRNEPQTDRSKAA